MLGSSQGDCETVTALVHAMFECVCIFFQQCVLRLTRIRATRRTILNTLLSVLLLHHATGMACHHVTNSEWVSLAAQPLSAGMRL
jgi:hypothetical protein